jgi:hypothetical protein
MKKAAILAHEELLERVQALSDGDTNSAGSSVCTQQLSESSQ